MSGSDKAMMEYLNALLEEEKKPVAEFNDEPIKKLLQKATATRAAPKPRDEVEPTPVADPTPREAPKPRDEVEPTPVEDPTPREAPKPRDEVEPKPLADPMQEYQSDDFQALFFRVAGLTLAVPLKSLGGIHTLSKISPIIGKPSWFKGIMTEREEKLQVVDTARWVMPEKITPELEEKIEYQYLITLNDSPWGLLCEELVDSEPLHPDSIQWRSGVNEKRPWLAGVVRDRMCALLDVNALITLLDNGLGHIKK
jgi:purine-binding chemotaxis protein CheW